nr:AAA family ATPase [uncultured Trichococcus sp.]
MSKKISKIKSMHINKFRGLENIDITFGERITLICGKNGTSKSTILGIIAQIFSFTTDYSVEPVQRNTLNQYKTLLGKPYSSLFSEHFRFSEEHDLPGTMDVDLIVFDGLENKLKDKLNLKIYNSKDRLKSRPVLRGNNDRNITLPVIYLSVNRLTPIATRKYEKTNNEYIEENEDLALSFANKILLQKNAFIDSTTGELESLATHNEKYDYQSISVGEDNVGQIVKAILSFVKLKKEFSNYSGGILLIDEADAGLFPAAQVEFFNLLRKVSREYGIQVIMTSHSPTLIQAVYEQKDLLNYKTIYLSDTFGSIQVMNDFSWADIDADINVTTKQVNNEIKFPPINIYFEDDEAAEFFNALIRKRKLTRLLNKSHTTLGGDQLLTLRKEKIPEFMTKSIVVLDADKGIPSEFKNFIKLPSNLPPDQLIFETLYNLQRENEYWRTNVHGLTKPIFERTLNNTVTCINFPNNSDTIDLESIVDEYRKTGTNKAGIVRTQFKTFYKSDAIQKVVKGSIKDNPFKIWEKTHLSEVEEFEESLIKSIKHVLLKGFNVPISLIDEYFE